jgi:hypothetical protein
MPLYPEHIPIVMAMADPVVSFKFLQICKDKSLMLIPINDYLDSVKRLLPNRIARANIKSSLTSLNTNRCGGCGGGGKVR